MSYICTVDGGESSRRGLIRAKFQARTFQSEIKTVTESLLFRPDRTFGHR